MADMKWIPVTERLPEMDDLVLTWNGCDMGMHIWDNKNRKFVKLDSIGSAFIEVRFVTHWMPLPEPPKEVE